MPYAIVVKVPQAEEHCFVAVPSDAAFSSVALAIDDAALRSEIEPLRLTRTKVGPDFIASIHTKIRSARIVVAVISPEPSTGVPNPNVLYELGLASALGKPTLILTTGDVQNLPADLRNRDVIEYDANDPQLAGKISEALLRSLQRLASSHLIDPDFDPDSISVAHAHHWRIMDPEGWDLFAKILRFAKDVHNAFQPFDTGHLDPLLRNVKGLLDTTIAARQAIQLVERWQETGDAYKVLKNKNGLESLPFRFGVVDHAYSQLLWKLPEPPKALTDSRDHYSRIKSVLEEYPAWIGEVDHGTSGSLRTLVRERGGCEEIWSSIFRLSQQTKALIVSADHMLLALLGLLLEGQTNA